jgi:hypothetical protein
MLGPLELRRLDQPIAVSLEALVPQNHFYRHLEATLDLGFVREWASERYAERGRPSIDPVVFFKLQLCPLRQSPGPPEGARVAHSCLRTVIDPA